MRINMPSPAVTRYLFLVVLALGFVVARTDTFAGEVLRQISHTLMHP